MSIGSLHNILEIHKILQINSRRASGTACYWHLRLALLLVDFGVVHELNI